MNYKSGIVFLVSVCILFGGCSAQPSYSVGPTVNLTEKNGDIHVDGEVVLGGTYSDELEVQGVVVRIRYNGSVQAEQNVGTVNQTRPAANFSFTVPFVPTKILVNYHDLRPQRYDGGTYHLEWQQDDQIYKEVDSSSPELTETSSS